VVAAIRGLVLLQHFFLCCLSVLFITKS
jgi:hypothetical protein